MAEPHVGPVAAAPADSTAFSLSIGAVHTGVVSADPGLALTVPAAVSAFLAEPGPPDVKVEARWCHEPHVETGRLRFDSGGLWRLHEADGRLVWTFRSSTFGAVPYKVAAFAPDFSAGTVTLHRPYFDPSVPIYPLEYPLDELLVTNWLALGRGVEIHACGIVDADGRGYLLAGHSGAGKSTIAGLWQAEPGVTILSDDRVILRKAGGRIWMYGTPWHGEEEMASPTAAPLTRGFFLHHAARNQIAAVGPGGAVASLLARSFPPFFSATAMDFVVAFLAEVSGLVPFADFGFVPDRHALRCLRDAR